MSDPRFVHLRMHSEYSVTDGIVRLGDAIGSAVADGMPSLALTDLSTLFGMVKFYTAARSAGVKPIIGCDVWIANETDRNQPYRLLLLCASRKGYLRLSELLTRAWLTNQHRGRPEMMKNWFSAAEGGAEGLIALSGAQAGDVGAALAQGNIAAAERAAAEWQAWLPDRYYIELQRSSVKPIPQNEAYINRALVLAAKFRLPAVATHPVQFMKREDFRAHEARVCIAEGYVLGDQRRPKLYTEEQYFKSQEEMAVLFSDLPDALANSVEIARRCNLSIELGKNRLPLFPTPDGSDLNDYLAKLSEKGLEERMAFLYPDEAVRADQYPRYRERLAFEIKTIIQMGFPGYFLIVADFINWAKNNDVPVGPGRGSGAGSLVAYALGITDLDPLEYDLLFERFLNPERVSMPDFDIDFCEMRRERVIDYVKHKYGAESVSQIATFGTMAAKAVIRDVGRVLDLGYNFCDGIAKLIPFQPGKLITLEMAREMEPILKEREEKEEEVRDLLELAGSLEGITRNVGKHAGGVLIAPGKLTDFCPLYSANGDDGVISQFDKDDVEAIGLVKFDFLGLTTLTILDWAVNHIRTQHPDKKDFRLETLPLDDKATYALLSEANTAAVFQLESRGMRDMLKQARPNCFEDIIALVSLYRPGPMDLIPEFCENKRNPHRVTYLDPRLEAIIGPTYGIMVYQEQVMQIAQVIGGYSLGGADLLRRAMGKKKVEEMAQQRDIFRAGAEKNGLSADKATELFDLMEKFAGYGFNKSHAAAYALLAYQTAYLKVHFPAEFMAATMSAIMDDTDKVHAIHADAVDNSIAVLLPDINLSEYRFMPVGQISETKQIRFGMGAVKGTGESAIENILAARKKGGPFRDLFDFCGRIDKRIVNRRAIEALVRAGGFDTLNENRAALLASVGIAVEAAEQAERNAQQNNLFGSAADAIAQQPKLLPAAQWSDKEKLFQEKLALGFFLSGHPYTSYRAELKSFIKMRLCDLSPSRDPLWLAGVVMSMRIQMTARGRMAIATLDDGTAQVDVTVFNEVYEQHRDKLKEDELLVIHGKVSKDGFTGGVRIVPEQLYSLTGARNHFAQSVKLSMNGQANATKLKALLTPYLRGPCPVTVSYHNGQAVCDMELGKEWAVNVDDRLLESLREWLSPENVQVIYR